MVETLRNLVTIDAPEFPWVADVNNAGETRVA
jgi:hypothetical protein